MKILIVGAGASGLMAAHTLLVHKHAVTVLEARDRTGGRIQTIQSGFRTPVDAGAEFMHGKQPLTTSLLEESETPIVMLSGTRYQLWDGEVHKGDVFDKDWKRLTRKLKDLEKDVDIASFLDQHFAGDQYDKLRKKVSGFVEGYDAADLRRVSALALREEWSEAADEDQYRIEGGYPVLIDFLESKIRRAGGDIRLSAPVTEIHWVEGNVKVITSAGVAFEADKVIVTVPLGALQKGTIKFSPPLPDHAAAFAAMGFGGVIKFKIEFNDEFWERSASRGMKDLSFVFSDAEIPTWWSHRPGGVALLTGWLGGPRTSVIANDPEVLYRKAVDSLAYIFDLPPAEIRNQIRTRNVFHWVHDPYTFGAYAYPTTGTEQALDIITAPVKNTLYFSGEAMYKGSAIGTVEAALVNGRDTAGRIL